MQTGSGGLRRALDRARAEVSAESRRSGGGQAQRVNKLLHFTLVGDESLDFHLAPAAFANQGIDLKNALH